MVILWINYNENYILYKNHFKVLKGKTKVIECFNQTRIIDNLKTTTFTIIGQTATKIQI